MLESFDDLLQQFESSSEAKRIVNEIRKNAQVFIDENEKMFSMFDNASSFYEQADEKEQLMSIEKLLERGINIEIVKTPVFIGTENKNEIFKYDKNYTVFQVKTRLIDTTLDEDIKSNVKTIFMFHWVEMKRPEDMVNSSMIRAATSTKKMYLVKKK